MSKPLYVCVTCAQDFTRGFDARRHNSKHHFKQAEIVSFIEYLIGRTNGTLPPPSQRPPRLAAKNQKKLLDFGNNNKQKNAGNKFTCSQDDATAIIAPHDPSRTSTYKSENSRQNDISPLTIKGPEYGLEINPSLHNKGMSSCCCEDQIRKANIQLHELKALLFVFYGSDCARDFIKSIVRHCNESGDYGYVEESSKNHFEGVAAYVFQVTYIHTCIHAYIHAYIRTYIHTESTHTNEVILLYILLFEMNFEMMAEIWAYEFRKFKVAGQANLMHTFVLHLLLYNYLILFIALRIIALLMEYTTQRHLIR